MQCNMGAKNHAVLLPDANMERSLDQVVGAAFGAAGQRCMALSVAIFVGETQNWLPGLKERAEKLKVNCGRLLCPLHNSLVTESYILVCSVLWS